MNLKAIITFSAMLGYASWAEEESDSSFGLAGQLNIFKFNPFKQLEEDFNALQACLNSGLQTTWDRIQAPFVAFFEIDRDWLQTIFLFLPLLILTLCILVEEIALLNFILRPISGGYVDIYHCSSRINIVISCFKKYQLMRRLVKNIINTYLNEHFVQY